MIKNQKIDTFDCHYYELGKILTFLFKYYLKYLIISGIRICVKIYF